jgi:hypothetical protein
MHGKKRPGARARVFWEATEQRAADLEAQQLD